MNNVPPGCCTTSMLLARPLHNGLLRILLIPCIQLDRQRGTREGQSYSLNSGKTHLKKICMLGCCGLPIATWDMTVACQQLKQILFPLFQATLHSGACNLRFSDDCCKCCGSIGAYSCPRHACTLGQALPCPLGGRMTPSLLLDLAHAAWGTSQKLGME